MTEFLFEEKKNPLEFLDNSFVGDILVVFIGNGSSWGRSSRKPKFTLWKG